MGFFAGCTTQTVETGGINWGVAPYSQSPFGSETYYQDLNFDNLLASIFTLFMLMIQNNWSTLVNGYEICYDNKNVRLFFIGFNLYTALLMINLLVGVILDMFALYFDAGETDGGPGEVEEMF